MTVSRPLPADMPAHLRRLIEGDEPARTHLFIAIRAALAAPVASWLSHFRAGA